MNYEVVVYNSKGEVRFRERHDSHLIARVTRHRLELTYPPERGYSIEIEEIGHDIEIR